MPTITISSQRRSDMLCGALEGGSNYWYFLGDDASDIVEKYGDRSKTPYVDLMWKAIEAGETIPVRGNEDEDSILGSIDLVSIENGEQRMVDQYPEHFADLFAENDDATTADIWFQLAVLGELVYG